MLHDNGSAVIAPLPAAKQGAFPARRSGRHLLRRWALPGILLPVALVMWAKATAEIVRIPAVESPVAGVTVALIGVLLFLPAASRLIPHPVYMGFCLLSTGLSVALSSASGLWLVSPIIALSCFALVAGERRNSQPPAGSAPLLSLLPPDEASPPGARNYVAFFLFMVLPWFAMYEAILAIGIPPDAVNGVSRFEQRLPVVEWTQFIYVSVYFVVLAVPFFARTRRDLRWFSVHGRRAMMVAYPTFLLIPLIAPKRPFLAHSLPGHLLLWQRTVDSPVAAFPSFHVIWALLAAEIYARRWPKFRLVAYGWAILVAASCVTTSQHSILDVLGGIATVALLVNARKLWEIVQPKAKRIADLQQKWNLHFVWTGVAALTALCLAQTVAGTEARSVVIIAAGMTLAGGAIGRSVREGLGFYGGILGAVFGAISGLPLGANFWLILTCLALGAAWAKIILLLQRIIESTCSTRGEWPRGLAWSCLTAGTVTRLWMLAAPLHLIVGLYLILTGLEMFAEQRRWASIACVTGGILVTALGKSTSAPAPQIEWNSLPIAAIFGLCVAVLFGIVSRRRNLRVIWRSA